MADLILINGDIRTQDPNQPRAQALAVTNGRIEAVGATADIQSLSLRGTRVIDAGGRLVLPGMTDSHIHALMWSLLLTTPPVGQAATLAEVLDITSRSAAGLEAGEWIYGMGLDESRWPEGRLPNRYDLDRAAPDNPVLYHRRDGHMAVANSLALKLAGIDENTPDPSGGSLDRDENGKPDGLLRELASGLVDKLVPAPTQAEAVDALRKSQPIFHSLGVTGIHDVRIPNEDVNPLAVWHDLERNGELKMRCWMCLAGNQLDQAIEVGLRTGFGNDYLRVGHVKYFVDGSMGSKTAWVLEPYDGDDCGIPVVDMTELAPELARADAAGLACAVHAIGDRANRELIDAFERIIDNRTGPAPAAPHRIEHAQMVRPEDIARLARLGLVASVQPLHISDDIVVHDQYLGGKACHIYAFRSMLDQGVALACGSDCPVSEPNPWWGIHAGVTRQRRDHSPAGGWYPDQRMKVDEAVRGYTLDAAASVGLENDLGNLATGKLADLVVVDRDIYAVDPKEIHDARVEMTLVGGEVVHEA